MTSLLIPRHVAVAQEYRERQERLDKRHGWLRHFDQALRDLDPYLELVRAVENPRDPQLRGGFWHVKRNNPGPVPPTYIVIESPHGEFMEPHSGVLDDLRGRDLRRRGFSEVRREIDEARAARDRARTHDRQTELAERMRFIGQGGHVSMSGVDLSKAKP